MASDLSGRGEFGLAEEPDGSLAMHLDGAVDVTNAADIEVLLQQAINQRPKVLTLDLRAVAFLDTAGIRLLIVAHRGQREAGNTLKVVVSEEGYVHRVLEMSGLLGILGIGSPCT